MERVKARFLHVVKRAALRGFALPDLDLRVGDESAFPAPRNFAYTELMLDGSLRIVVAPKMWMTPVGNIDGVLMHEFGHAALMSTGQLDHSERDADEMARRIFGCRIAYDSHDVQTTGNGVAPRPRYLPK